MGQSRKEGSSTYIINTIKESVAKGATIALLTQPNRILLSNASLFANPITTIRYSFPSFSYLLTGVHINVARGTLSAGSQVCVKTLAEEEVSHLPVNWRPAPVLAATSVAGMVVALAAETPFIRKPFIKAMLENKHAMQRSILPGLMRFTPALAPLYFCREMGYSVVVFYSKEIDPLSGAALTGAGTFFTGMTHKFIVQEATRDLYTKTEVLPNFAKDGVIKTIKNMANGNVYTQPSMQVIFKNPQSMSKKIINFMHVSCGLNMFLFRGAYLLASREILDQANKYLEKRRLG